MKAPMTYTAANEAMDAYWDLLKRGSAVYSTANNGPWTRIVTPFCNLFGDNIVLYCHCRIDRNWLLRLTDDGESIHALARSGCCPSQEKELIKDTVKRFGVTITDNDSLETDLSDTGMHSLIQCIIWLQQRVVGANTERNSTFAAAVADPGDTKT